jgi:Domain of Unknown Function with PDB structure (DUF3857)/Transglutaminase-like superfamily
MKISLKTIFFLAVYPFFCDFLIAQKPFATSNIPANLLENADKVIRLDETIFELKSLEMAIETEHKVITILNEKAAENELEQVFQYDNLNKIEDIKAAYYDSNGELVKRLKKKDIEDRMMPRQLFVDDSRYKIIHFPRLSFPFTIEFTVVTVRKNLMFYTRFSPQYRPRTSVEDARFTVITAEKSAKVRVLEQNIAKNVRDGDKLTWHFHHLRAVKSEDFMPDDGYKWPMVLTAPSKFIIDGRAGDQSTWLDYGKFMYELNQTQTKLPPEFEQEVKKIVADCASDSCKIARLYHFLQENTRYFYVGMGIGGWQPKLAADVHSTKYGDCKALSNYLVSMLRAVNVPANYALIRATESERLAQFPDFANAWFNHATVCVPSKNDTIWLECTSQTQSEGFLGDFTDDRAALLISENGGFLVKTPKYDEKTNKIERKVHILITEDGAAKLTSTSKRTGISQQGTAELMRQSIAEQQKAIYNSFNFSDFVIDKINFEQKKARIPSVTMQLELTIPHLGSVSGKRIFVPISIFTSNLPNGNLAETRQFPIQITSRSFSEENIIDFTLPEDYVLESTLPPISIESAFGTFEMTIFSTGNSLLVSQKMVLKGTIQPAEKWPDFQNFQKSIFRAFKSKLVFVKKT